MYLKRSSSITLTTLFELAQGLTYLVHIDEYSKPQFKFGVFLCFGMTRPTGTTDYQPALETNNQRKRSSYYWRWWGGRRGNRKEGSKTNQRRKKSTKP